MTILSVASIRARMHTPVTVEGLINILNDIKSVKGNFFTDFQIPHPLKMMSTKIGKFKLSHFVFSQITVSREMQKSHKINRFPLKVMRGTFLFVKMQIGLVRRKLRLYMSRPGPAPDLHQTRQFGVGEPDHN